MGGGSTWQACSASFASGTVATTFEPGATASVHETAGWRFAEAHSWFTPEGLLGEVHDWIDRLNGRLDSRR
jgi:hypothetical protein